MAPKQYLDDSGNPIAAPAKQYLDESGNPISAQSAAPAPRNQPEARTFGNYASEIARGVGRGLKNDVFGLATTVDNPTKALADLYAQSKDAVSAAGKEFRQTAPAPMGQRVAATALKGLENAPMIGGMVQHAEQGGTKPGSPESFGAAAEGVTTFEAPGLAVKGVKALAPRIGEGITGTGTGATKDLVKDTKAANVADAAKVADANHAAALKHLEDTQKAMHETAGRELTHAEALQAAADEAAAKRKVQLTKHLADTAKAEAQRHAAQETFESDRAAQRRIAPQEKKLSDSQSGLRAAVETAREKALRVGNEQYNAVNEKLNPLPADMEAVHGAYYEAAESIGETQAQPPLLKRVGTALKDGDGLSYRDLQPIYSELGKELSKGTLPGSVYHAYDVMHDAIGKEMQRIADSQGQGAQLSDARGYWRRMKQTFGKPIRFGDAATKAIGGVKDEIQDNQIRLLGSFDPEIPKQFSHVQNIEKGADSLPKPVPERELTRKLAESRPALPERPAPVQARLPEPPERVAPPNRPNEMLPAPKKIGAEDVQAAKSKGLASRADLVKHKASWIAAGPPIYAMVDMLKGHGVNLGEVAGVTAGIGGLSIAVGRLLENPSVVDFLTKATDRDVAAIPEDLRGDFPQIARQAQKQGIQLSPAIARTAQGSAALAPRQHPTDEWQGIQP